MKSVVIEGKDQKVRVDEIELDDLRLGVEVYATLMTSL